MEKNVGKGEPEMLKKGLNGTILKIWALAAMTLDHIGLILLRDFLPFRIIGRMAFPIFAYMIAEGCRYTRHKARYFFSIFSVGAVSQTVLYFVTGSLHQNVMLTFSLSVLLIYALQLARERETPAGWLPFAGLLILTALLCFVLPFLLPDTDYGFDYRFFGILLPMFISLSVDRRLRLMLCAMGLLAVFLYIGGIQWWAMLALIPLSLYDGSPGKYRLKYLFYLYYPLHLAAIYGIAMLIH